MPQIEPDWALWRSFAAVVAHGSLSAAGRAIGYSQPTLGRHIETLEQQLGVVLFERSGQGLTPTRTGLRLHQSVAIAEAKLAEAVEAVEGDATELTGSVRIAAGELVLHGLLPPLLRDLRTAFPGVALELLPAGTRPLLLPRDADIVLAEAPLDGAGMVSRRIGEMVQVLTAHAGYLGAHGVPASAAELPAHALVWCDRDETLLRLAAGAGLSLDRADIGLRTDAPAAAWELLKAGLGLGLAPLALVRATPGMREVLPQLRPAPQALWLSSSRELFLSPRIRAIYEQLASGLGDALASVRPHE